MIPKWISPLFWVAALYDGALGFVFLFLPLRIFEWQAVTPPNHIGYVQFPAALLLIFTVMFVMIALDPTRRKEFIPLGILLKVAYAGTVFWHWTMSTIPTMWKPFAVIDVAFGLLFIIALIQIGKSAEPIPEED